MFWKATEPYCIDCKPVVWTLLSTLHRFLSLTVPLESFLPLFLNLQQENILKLLKQITLNYKGSNFSDNVMKKWPFAKKAIKLCSQPKPFNRAFLQFDELTKYACRIMHIKTRLMDPLFWIFLKSLHVIVINAVHLNLYSFSSQCLSSKD